MFWYPLQRCELLYSCSFSLPLWMLALYRLSALISLYPCTISALKIPTLVLHTLPLRVLLHIANNFLSNIIPLTIPPPPHIQCISNWFTLQPLPAKHTWHIAYQQDSSQLMFHLINPRSSTSRQLIVQLFTVISLVFLKVASSIMNNFPLLTNIFVVF